MCFLFLITLHHLIPINVAHLVGRITPFTSRQTHLWSHLSAQMGCVFCEANEGEKAPNLLCLLLLLPECCPERSGSAVVGRVGVKVVSPEVVDNAKMPNLPSRCQTASSKPALRVFPFKYQLPSKYQYSLFVTLLERKCGGGAVSGFRERESQKCDLEHRNCLVIRVCGRLAFCARQQLFSCDLEDTKFCTHDCAAIYANSGRSSARTCCPLQPELQRMSFTEQLKTLSVANEYFHAPIWPPGGGGVYSTKS